MYILSRSFFLVVSFTFLPFLFLRPTHLAPCLLITRGLEDRVEVRNGEMCISVRASPVCKVADKRNERKTSLANLSPSTFPFERNPRSTDEIDRPGRYTAISQPNIGSDPIVCFEFVS